MNICKINKIGHFMFYNKPITNTQVGKEISVKDVFDYITGTEGKKATEQFRACQCVDKKHRIKNSDFDFVLFSGTFKKRNNEGLVKHSSLLCLDFDHLGEKKNTLHEQLLTDRYFETVLLFILPVGMD